MSNTQNLLYPPRLIARKGNFATVQPTPFPGLGMNSIFDLSNTIFASLPPVFMVFRNAPQVIGVKDLVEKLIAHCLRFFFGISNSEQPKTIDIYIPALFQIINVYSTRFGIQYLLKKILALIEESLNSFAIRNFGEQDQETIGRRVDAILKPEIPRLIVILEDERYLFPHRLFVCDLKGLAYPFGIFCPDMFANQISRFMPLQHDRSLLVYVDVMPVFIQHD